jgi:hypothetical protein
MVQVSRTPKSVLEFKTLYQRRVDGAPGLTTGVLKPEELRTREIGFCKRSVPVAFCSVELRKVASAYGQTPKSVLTRTFNQVRRAVRTAKFTRMSQLLANTQEKFRSRVTSFAFGPASSKQVLLRQREDQMASKSSEWRQLSDVVSNVLRNINRIQGSETVPISWQTYGAFES